MIAPEGKIILIPASILLLIFGFMSFKTEGMWIKSFFIFDFIFVIFSLYFFRDPDHAMPEDKSLFISPADGKVVQIIDVNDLEVGQAKQISIFLSVFNVHKQAVPMCFIQNIIKVNSLQPGTIKHPWIMNRLKFCLKQNLE